MLWKVLLRVLREILCGPGSASEGALPVNPHRKSTLGSTFESTSSDFTFSTPVAGLIVANVIVISKEDYSRGQELNTNLFFLNFSGTPGTSPQTSRDIPPKGLVSLGFEGHTELLGPHPFTWKTSHPTREYPHQKVWVWVLISCLKGTSQVTFALVTFPGSICEGFIRHRPPGPPPPPRIRFALPSSGVDLATVNGCTQDM